MGGANNTFGLRVHRAEEMLHSFASVGITVFDLTCTDIAGQKTVFRKNRPFPTLTAQIPVILDTCDRKEWNVIIRPHAIEGRVVVQLDDLDRQKLIRVEELSFLTIGTSPGSFQAWVAVESSSENLIRRLRQATGADIHASGATRIAGSRNFKPKYSPEYPTVSLIGLAARLTVTEKELNDRGLLAPEERPDRPPMFLPPSDSEAAARKFHRHTNAVSRPPRPPGTMTAKTALTPTSNTRSLPPTEGSRRPR